MTDQRRPFWQRVATWLRDESTGIHARVHAATFGAYLYPRGSEVQKRANVMRWCGFHIGSGSGFADVPKMSGRTGVAGRLHVGRDCSIDIDCIFDLEEHITLEDRVTIGPGVMILTSSHELASAQHRAGPVTKAPVKIGEGAWLRPRCIVLPGVTIGAGAIVEAGAVVNKDVAPHTRVAGSPAAQVEVLDGQAG